MKNMANILGTLQHARETPVEDEAVTPEATAKPAPAAKSAPPKKQPEARPKPTASPIPTKTVGKSSNPDFEPVKVLLRKTTRKKAERKWNDATDQDFSDLVEHLLLEYLGKEQ